MQRSDTSFRLSLYTYTQREEAWFQNFAENLQRIRGDPDIQDLPHFKGEPALIVGAGPSMKKFNLLEKARGFKGRVFAADRMLVPCLDAGLKPDVVVSVDGDPIVANFYPHDRYREFRDVHPVFGTQVHPSVVGRWERPIHWFIPMYDDPLAPKQSITRMVYWMCKTDLTEKTCVNAFGNVGALAVAIANHLECSPIILLGIDFSYGEEKNHTLTTYWNGFLEEYRKAGKGPKDVIKNCYRFVKTGFGHLVLTDIVFYSYMQALTQGLEKMKARVINVSPYSIVGGEGVEYLPIEEAVKMA